MTDPEEEIQTENILDVLLEKADLQGQITIEDLFELIPENRDDPKEVGKLMKALRRNGVNVIDSSSEEEFVVDDLDSDLTDEFSGFANLEPISSDDTISLYLREMSQVPLLNMEEEVSLAKRIEAGKSAHQEVDRLNGNGTPEKKQELLNQMEDGLLAREHIIKANTRLVVSVAKRYNGRGVPFSSKPEPPVPRRQHTSRCKRRHHISADERLGAGFRGGGTGGVGLVSGYRPAGESRTDRHLRVPLPAGEGQIGVGVRRDKPACCRG